MPDHPAPDAHDAVSSFWLNDDGWQIAWPAAISFALLFHGFAFAISAQTPPKPKPEPIVMAISLPPPPPEPPPPEPEKPKPKPKEKPVDVPPQLVPPPNQEPTPSDEPPPEQIVTGVTADSVVAESAGGPAVRVGNTTMGNPEEEEPVPPDEVQPIRAKVAFDAAAYRTNAIALVNKEKRYPRKAQVLGLQGNVVVKVELDRDGNIISGPSIVGRGSGHDVLDAEAIRMVKVSAPFPKLIGDDVVIPHRVVFPIQFRVTDP